jgi:hypothetical protein
LEDFPKALDYDILGGRFLIGREGKKIPCFVLEKSSDLVDGVISIVDERKLDKCNFQSHLSGQINEILTTRETLKYLVCGENGFLVYKPNNML